MVMTVALLINTDNFTVSAADAPAQGRAPAYNMEVRANASAEDVASTAVGAGSGVPTLATETRWGRWCATRCARRSRRLRTRTLRPHRDAMEATHGDRRGFGGWVAWHAPFIGRIDPMIE